MSYAHNNIEIILDNISDDNNNLNLTDNMTILGVDFDI